MPRSPITPPTTTKANELDLDFWKTLNLSTNPIDQWIQNINVITLEQKKKVLANLTDQVAESHINIMKVNLNKPSAIFF